MQNKLGIGITALGVIVVVLAAVLGWAVVPKIIDDKIKEEVRLVNGSTVMDTWADIPYPIFLTFYIFNVTNPDEVEAGGIPKLQEVGPYAYRQKRQKVNLSNYDLANPENTLQYKERKTYNWDPVASGSNKESDLVNVINIPFIAVVHGVRSQLAALAPTIANVALEGEKLIRRKVAVNELLFDGFDVSKYTNNTLLSALLPSEFDGGRFGIYKGENGTDSLMYDIYTGVDNHEDFGKIRTYNEEEYLHFWQEGTECDKVRGSDGSLFPPFMKKDSEFYVFSSDLCRSLKFNFDSQQKFNGVKVYRYRVPRWELEDPRINKENQCYCLTATLDECPKAGTMSLEGCRGGAPIMMSTPYFLDGNEDYLNVTGMPKPDADKHMTYLDIEPNSGVLLRGHKRIQVNLDLKVGYNIDAYKNLSKDIVFPLLWADESAEIDDENLDDLKDRLLKPKNIVNIVRWVLIAVGIVIVAAGAFIFYKRRKSASTI